jgi:GntR family transcriptional regulator, transcriptional repressor for pyruvate dehydrogenase complex
MLKPHYAKATFLCGLFYTPNWATQLPSGAVPEWKGARPIFTPVTRYRLYEEVVRQIVDLIRSGDIRPGERLPSERELEGMIHVSRGVLREAFRVLESRGLVVSRPGGGRFLRELPAANPAGAADSQWLTTRLEQAVLLDLWEAREALETKSAELAARRATPADLDAMRKIADQLVRGHSGTDMVALNREFHLTIAVAAHNAVLYHLVETQISLLTQIRGRVPFDLDLLEPEHASEDHHAIIDAIAARDPQRARELIETHLQVNRRKFETAAYVLTNNPPGKEARDRSEGP